MSCKYNNCKICGYKSECEIYKENAELRESADFWEEHYWILNDVYVKCANEKDIWLSKAKKLVQNLLNVVVTEVTLNPLYLKLTQEAEQFLKEVEEWHVCGEEYQEPNEIKGVTMFEKEAKEYVNEEEHLHGSAIEQVFKDGAEFGYNKANEWHKPNEKLPEECSLVLAYLFEETEPTICEYVVSNQWECLPKRIVFCSNDQVRLWKEIVLP